MKLALGTAQFGSPYGIANGVGRLGLSEIEAIIALARESGVDTLDTAIAYGDSEARLGVVGVDGFKIVTKLPVALDADPKSWAQRHLEASLKRLKVNSIYGLLLHRSEYLSGPHGPEIAAGLQLLKKEGLVRKIGVSIYDPSELNLVARECAIDLVQAPFNLFDRRLETSGWLNRLNNMGVEVHARSIFLQGLLLMERECLPKKFLQWSGLFNNWYAWLSRVDVTASEACIAFSSHPLINRVLVGVDSVAQLNQIVKLSSKQLRSNLPNLNCNDLKLINPSNWNSL